MTFWCLIIYYISIFGPKVDKLSHCLLLIGSHQLLKQEDDDYFNSSSDLTVSITDSDEMSADDLLDAIDGKEERTTDTKKSKVQEVECKTNKKTPDQDFENTKHQNSDEESSSISAMGR